MLVEKDLFKLEFMIVIGLGEGLYYIVIVDLLIIISYNFAIENDKDFNKVKLILYKLVYLPTLKDTFLKAAQIYRHCRKKGITIRKPIDCMIAAICLENSTYIIHNDKDFYNISKHFKLQSF